MWLDAHGDWDGAHEAAQADEGGDGDWAHAYLHRKEGDAGNAAYWYRRAGKPVCKILARRGMDGDRKRAACRRRLTTLCRRVGGPSAQENG